MNSDADSQAKKKKRDHGTGTVYYVSSIQKWRARLIVDGKAINKNANTEQEAKKLLKQIIKNQKELASQKKYNTKSFGDYLDNWLVLYKKNSLAPSSYRNIEYDINRYVKPHIGSIQLASLTTDDIQGMIGKLVSNRMSLSIIKRARSATDSCLKKAVQLHDIPFNPCSAIEMPSAKKNEKLKKQPICVLDENEVSNYINAATDSWPNGTPYYRIGWGFVLVLATGIRKGELAALSWDDINTETKQMHIHRNAVIVANEDKNSEQKSEQLIQESTKSESGNRYIPLNQTALTALENLKKETGNYKYVVGVSKDEPCNISTLSQMHRRIMARAGITRPNGIKKGMHSLRHTFCSNLIMSGMDIKTISELMGHSDIGVTLDVYGHIFNKRKQEAVEATDFIKLTTK